MRMQDAMSAPEKQWAFEGMTAFIFFMKIVRRNTYWRWLIGISIGIRTISDNGVIDPLDTVPVTVAAKVNVIDPIDTIPVAMVVAVPVIYPVVTEPVTAIVMVPVMADNMGVVFMTAEVAVGVEAST